MDNEFEKTDKPSSESENYCDFLKAFVSYENDNNEEKVLNRAYESSFDECCSCFPFGNCSSEDK